MTTNQYGTFSNHGLRHTRLYNIWSGLKARCNRKSNHDYKLYGARGIRVCDEWNDFTRFYAWATAHGYSETLTIDRIDTDGDYTPSNCRWVNWKTQANNKRNNHMITFRGKRATLQQWADSVGIKANTLLYRLKRGWSVERALTT